MARRGGVGWPHRRGIHHAEGRARFNVDEATREDGDGRRSKARVPRYRRYERTIIEARPPTDEEWVPVRRRKWERGAHRQKPHFRSSLGHSRHGPATSLEIIFVKCLPHIQNCPTIRDAIGTSFSAKHCRISSSPSEQTRDSG